MTDDRMNQMADDVRYIRTRLDQHITAQAERDRSVGERISAVEVKSGLWGLLGGLLSGVGIHLKGGA